MSSLSNYLFRPASLLELPHPIDCALCHKPLAPIEEEVGFKPILDPPEGEELISWYSEHQADLPLAPEPFLQRKSCYYYQLTTRDPSHLIPVCGHVFHELCLINTSCTGAADPRKPRDFKEIDCESCRSGFYGTGFGARFTLDFAAYWDSIPATIYSLNRPFEISLEDPERPKKPFMKAYRTAARTNAHFFRQTLLECVVHGAYVEGVFEKG